MSKKPTEARAVMSTAHQNDLPDDAFAHVEPGEKDESGRTTPRSKRHLPYRHADGSIDMAHLRNALARLSQTNISEAAKASARRKLVAAAKEVGIEVSGGRGGERAAEEAEVTRSAAPPAADGAVEHVLTAPITRVDPDKRLVTVTATSEAVDTFGTIFDYEASKDAFLRWVGNVREMHQPKAVGSRVGVHFDDAARKVEATIRVSKGAQDTWEKILDGTLKGASIGASNVAWEHPTSRDGGRSYPRARKYDLVELSLVDNPSNPDALGITVVRSAQPDTAILDEIESDEERAEREAQEQRVAQVQQDIAAFGDPAAAAADLAREMLAGGEQMGLSGALALSRGADDPLVAALAGEGAFPGFPGLALPAQVRGVAAPIPGGLPAPTAPAPMAFPPRSAGHGGGMQVAPVQVPSAAEADATLPDPLAYLAAIPEQVARRGAAPDRVHVAPAIYRANLVRDLQERARQRYLADARTQAQQATAPFDEQRETYGDFIARATAATAGVEGRAIARWNDTLRRLAQAQAQQATTATATITTATAPRAGKKAAADDNDRVPRTPASSEPAPAVAGESAEEDGAGDDGAGDSERVAVVAEARMLGSQTQDVGIAVTAARPAPAVPGTRVGEEALGREQVAHVHAHAHGASYESHGASGDHEHTHTHRDGTSHSHPHTHDHDHHDHGIVFSRDVAGTGGHSHEHHHHHDHVHTYRNGMPTDSRLATPDDAATRGKPFGTQQGEGNSGAVHQTSHASGQLKVGKGGPAGNDSVSPIVTVQPQQVGHRVLYNTEDVNAVEGGVPAPAEERPSPTEDITLNPEQYHEGGHAPAHGDAGENTGDYDEDGDHDGAAEDAQQDLGASPLMPRPTRVPRDNSTVKNSGYANGAGLGQVNTLGRAAAAVASGVPQAGGPAAVALPSASPAGAANVANMGQVSEDGHDGENDDAPDAPQGDGVVGDGTAPAATKPVHAAPATFEAGKDPADTTIHVNASGSPLPGGMASPSADQGVAGGLKRVASIPNLTPQTRTATRAGARVSAESRAALHEVRDTQLDAVRRACRHCSGSGGECPECETLMRVLDAGLYGPTGAHEGATDLKPSDADDTAMFGQLRVMQATMQALVAREIADARAALAADVARLRTELDVAFTDLRGAVSDAQLTLADHQRGASATLTDRLTDHLTTGLTHSLTVALTGDVTRAVEAQVAARVDAALSPVLQQLGALASVAEGVKEAVERMENQPDPRLRAPHSGVSLPVEKRSAFSPAPGEFTGAEPGGLVPSKADVLQQLAASLPAGDPLRIRIATELASESRRFINAPQGVWQQ